jgi:hypothetical protein
MAEPMDVDSEEEDLELNTEEDPSKKRKRDTRRKTHASKGQGGEGTLLP